MLLVSVKLKGALCRQGLQNATQQFHFTNTQKNSNTAGVCKLSRKTRSNRLSKGCAQEVLSRPLVKRNEQ